MRQTGFEETEIRSSSAERADRSPLVRIALRIYGPATAFLLLAVLAGRLPGFSFAFFSREPTATLNGHAMTGALSQIGVLAWCVGAAVCFFAWSLSRRPLAEPAASKASPTGSFFFWAGALTTLLLFDDLFRVHEVLAWEVVGIGEKRVLGSYVLLASAFVARFWRTLLAGSDRRALFLAATVFFALSLGIDFNEGAWDSPWRIVFEDGFKLFGIFSWIGYLVWSAWLTIEWAPSPSSSRRAPESVQSQAPPPQASGRSARRPLRKSPDRATP